MPRIRTIKPEFWDSEKLAKLPYGARLLFIGLLNLADDSGRLRGAVEWVHGRVFPYDPEAPVAEWLKDLERIGTIRIYAVAGETFIDIPNFKKHQKIDKPSTSRLPPFPEDSAKLRGGLDDDSPLEQGTGIKDQGTGTMEQGAASRAEPASPPELRQIDGTGYQVPEETWTAWGKAYPGVDLVAECRKAAAWEASNPTRAKVNKQKFLNSWLSKAQDNLKGGNNGPGQHRPVSARSREAIGSQPGKFDGHPGA